MEKQRLPNATLIIVFGIVSIVTFCCFGIFGLIFGLIALVMANSAIRKYKQEPELWSGYENVKVGRILAIIGIAINLLYLARIIYVIATLGFDNIWEMQQEIMEQWE